eukprot:GHVL01008717.1.p1 GENE.GHVL01008717.1~~GHVL01008717.1.p1  ORF type:complete len:304 (+),score=46.98 GHVL01008717.1:28-939(+)
MILTQNKSISKNLQKNSLHIQKYIYFSFRNVIHIKSYRAMSYRPRRIGCPKSEWYLAKEKEFMAERAQRPHGYIRNLSSDDVSELSPTLRKLLSMKCASNMELHTFRKRQFMFEFQRRPFDTNSFPVRLSILTEKILNMRQHIVSDFIKHRHKRDKLNEYSRRRTKLMKAFSKIDYASYKETCDKIGIKCVNFTVPMPRSGPSKSFSPHAIDGDKCKWLIRQRLFRSKYRPLPHRAQHPEALGLERYTRHPLHPPPDTHNKPVPHHPIVNRKWPYGVTDERISGKYVLHNPTKVGWGYTHMPL